MWRLLSVQSLQPKPIASDGKIPEEIVFVNKYWQHDHILDNIKHRVELVHE